MQNRFSLLEGTIKAECGRGPVYYFANFGNWGDGLIRHGTLKFFQDINLNYKEIKLPEKAARRLPILVPFLVPFLKRGTVKSYDPFDDGWSQYEEPSVTIH